MSKHLALGRQGETLASQWLQENEYTLIDRNFRWGKTEIDIVATRGEWLHIIEVKTISSVKWGTPELRVNDKKIKKLQQAAGILLQMTHRKWVQYDVIAITWLPGESPLIELFEDVS